MNEQIEKQIKKLDMDLYIIKLMIAFAIVFILVK